MTKRIIAALAAGFVAATMLAGCSGDDVEREGQDVATTAASGSAKRLGFAEFPANMENDLTSEEDFA